jgi:hypothetical protein
MKTPALIAAIAFLLIAPAVASAQPVKLQIQNGLVTLDAQNVSVRQILAEWARIGGAKIVNAEKVGGGPVTLQLKGVPERQALDTILRGVSGYMLASRQAGATGVSGFDRILILPTSAGPRPTPAPATASFPNGVRPIPVQAQPAEAVETDIVEDVDQGELEPDVDQDEDAEEMVQPQPGMNPRVDRRMFPNPMGGQPGNFPQPVDGDEDIPSGQQPQQSTMPFNVPPGASATPGVISPAPQQDPNQPRVVRPPRPPL